MRFNSKDKVTTPLGIGEIISSHLKSMYLVRILSDQSLHIFYFFELKKVKPNIKEMIINFYDWLFSDKADIFIQKSCFSAIKYIFVLFLAFCASLLFWQVLRLIKIIL